MGCRQLVQIDPPTDSPDDPSALCDHVSPYLRPVRSSAPYPIMQYSTLARACLIVEAAYHLLQHETR